MRRLRRDHAHHEHRQRAPLVAPERLAQDDHSEDGRGERLSLIQELKKFGAEVRGGDELQIVLQRVAQRGHGHLGRVVLALPDVRVEKSERPEWTTLFDKEDTDAEEELEQLGEEHRDRHDVLGAHARHHARVPQQQHM